MTRTSFQGPTSQESLLEPPLQEITHASEERHASPFPTKKNAAVGIASNLCEAPPIDKPNAARRSHSIETPICSGIVDSTSSIVRGRFYDDFDVIMRFDLDTRFGPFIGMDPIARWDRAARLGLSPCPKVREILLKHKGEVSGDANKRLW